MPISATVLSPEAIKEIIFLKGREKISDITSRYHIGVSRLYSIWSSPIRVRNNSRMLNKIVDYITEKPDMPMILYNNEPSVYQTIEAESSPVKEIAAESASVKEIPNKVGGGLQDLENKVANRDAAIEQLLAEKEKISSDLFHKNKNISILESRCYNLQEHITEQEQIINKLNSDLANQSDLQNTIHNLTNKNTALEAYCNGLKNKNVSLEEYCNGLKNDIKNLKSNLTVSNPGNASISGGRSQEENDQANEIKTLKEMTAGYEVDINYYCDVIKSLQKKLAKYEK
jgi:chromosome segregation ATPase